jgi:hypothetical protein
MGPDALDVIDAVLQAENNGFGLKLRRNASRRFFGVEALHAEQDQPCRANRSDIGRGRERDVFVRAAAQKVQTLSSDYIYMAGTAYQRHCSAGARQHAAEIAADRTRAHDSDPRPGPVRHSVDPQRAARY